MVITHVEVSYGLTYSCNFQGCRIDVSYRAAVKEGEDPEEIRDALTKLARQRCEEGVARYQEEAD